VHSIFLSHTPQEHVPELTWTLL